MDKRSFVMLWKLKKVIGTQNVNTLIPPPHQLGALKTVTVKREIRCQRTIIQYWCKAMGYDVMQFMETQRPTSILLQWILWWYHKYLQLKHYLPTYVRTVCVLNTSAIKHFSLSVHTRQQLHTIVSFVHLSRKMPQALWLHFTCRKMSQNWGYRCKFSNRGKGLERNQHILSHAFDGGW